MGMLQWFEPWDLQFPSPLSSRSNAECICVSAIYISIKKKEKKVHYLFYIMRIGKITLKNKVRRLINFRHPEKGEISNLRLRVLIKKGN